jgi:hypothetical protein
MTDDDRPEGKAGPPNADTTLTEIDDEVVLPEHASAYYSPRPPPAATEHATIETAAIRLDPSIDVQHAETRRISVEALSPTLWFDAPNSSDNPVAFSPPRPEPYVNTRLVVGSIWALVLVLGAIYWIETASTTQPGPVAANAPVVTAISNVSTPALSVAPAAGNRVGGSPTFATLPAAPSNVPSEVPPTAASAELAVNDVAASTKVRRRAPSGAHTGASTAPTSRAVPVDTALPKAWIK